MPTEKDKMLAGSLFNSADPELVELRLAARLALASYNASPHGGQELRGEILSGLLGYTPEKLHIEPPFYCDYGFNIRFGSNVYMNFNCTILDIAGVTIGNNVLIGPGVQIYTVNHPLSPLERRSGLEYGKPVNIGDDCWIGGGAIIVPGVTIGKGVTVGAGSVVASDVADNLMVVGNPCRVVKFLGS